MLNKEDNFIVITIADVMTSDPRCVNANVSVEEVIEIFAKTNFAGLPVTDESGGLVGIVTQYDLVTKGSGIHIPTLVKAMEQVKMIHPERMILEETLAPIKKLLVKDIMNTDPLYVAGDEPIEKAVESFAEHHKVNPLIVVDKNKKVIGVLSRHDLIKILAMKELGRTVESAYSRQRAAGESEEVVGEAMRGIKRNFLFMPKYGAGKWVALGLALFVIGLAASFLFIVKIPDLSKDVEDVSQTVTQNGYLYMKSDSKTIRVGEIISVDLYVRFSSEVNSVGTILSTIFFDDGLEFVRVFSLGGEEFVSGAQILNLKTKEITFIWNSPVAGLTPIAEKEYYLGSLELRAVSGGDFGVNFKKGTQGSADYVSIGDLSGKNILKEAEDLRFVIN